MSDAQDLAWMEQALAQARLAIGLAEPNPRVGCVLVSPNGQLLGAGHTQAPGQAHAEIMALRDAQAQGHDVRGAIAYVTLEPCSHQGRTGPCCDALAAAGIGEVVAALADPNPLVNGLGFARLQAAGVTVRLGPGAEQARELNLGFFSRMLRRRPWVRMKIAASLDGKTALDNGQSQWITSEQARADGQHWRARACAVLTGIGTVRDDNPRLDVRLESAQRQPRLVVVDSRLETPPDARLFDARRPVAIYAASAPALRADALQARGAQLTLLPGGSETTRDKVDLAAMLDDLARMETNEVHVEAGHKLNGSLLREGLVDELLVYLAPRLIGAGRPMAAFGPLVALSESLPLEFLSSTMIGPDLRLLARLAGRDRF